MTFLNSPDFALKVFSDAEVERLHEEALKLLETVGVAVEEDAFRDFLFSRGAGRGPNNEVRFDRKMVAEALKSVPKELTLYDREGEPACFMGGRLQNSYYNPGGCSINWLEEDGRTVRPSRARDQVELSSLVADLPNVDMQSDTVTLHDLPDRLGDPYGAYLCFRHCKKPMVGGQISFGTLDDTARVLAAMAGGAEALAQKPRLLMDCTPTAPLKWCGLASSTIKGCGRHGIPVEFISVPMPGAVSPVTLAGSVLLHTAETLSGLVMTQLVRPGLGVVYGGAPMYFDMATSKSLLAGLESILMAMGTTQMGKFYGLPTHAYAGLSDAKFIDMQAGWEDAFTGLLALLSGINSVSGLSQLDFCLVSSAEKLVAANDLIGKFKRLRRGIAVNDDTLAVDLITKLGPGGDYITSRHTLKWFKKEAYFPTPVVDRKGRREDGASGTTMPDLVARARDQKKKILEAQSPDPQFPTREDMDKTMISILKEHGLKKVPCGPDF